MPLSAKEVATLLQEWYDRLKRVDKNRFRLLYYQASIGKVQALGDEFATMSRYDLARATGLSEDFSRKVLTLRDRGTHYELEDLREHTTIAPRLPRGEVTPVVQDILNKFRATYPNGKIEVCGSYRRGATELKDLDFMVAGVSIKEYQTFVKSLGPNYGEVDIKAHVPISEGKSIPVDFRRVPEESWGAALLWFTGSGQFNVECRTAAKNRGWTLTQYGLTDSDGKTISMDEREILEKLGISWRPPEQR